MFTIKHVTTLGNEAIVAAEEVTFSTAANQTADSDHPPQPDHEPLRGCVFYVPSNPQGPDSTILQLLGGTVYVMNKFGSTVAKYDLGGWHKNRPQVG